MRISQTRSRVEQYGALLNCSVPPDKGFAGDILNPCLRMDCKTTSDGDAYAYYDGDARDDDDDDE